MTTVVYLPSLPPPDHLVPSASPSPTESTAIYNTIGRKYTYGAPRSDPNTIDPSSDDDDQGHCCHRLLGTKLVLMSKDVMEISDHSAASLAVLQVVAMDALGAN